MWFHSRTSSSSSSFTFSNTNRDDWLLACNGKSLIKQIKSHWDGNRKFSKYSDAVNYSISISSVNVLSRSKALRRCKGRDLWLGRSTINCPLFSIGFHWKFIQLNSLLNENWWKIFCFEGFGFPNLLANKDGQWIHEIEHEVVAWKALFSLSRSDCLCCTSLINHGI